MAKPGLELIGFPKISMTIILFYITKIHDLQNQVSCSNWQQAGGDKAGPKTAAAMQQLQLQQQQLISQLQLVQQRILLVMLHQQLQTSP